MDIMMKSKEDNIITKKQWKKKHSKYMYKNGKKDNKKMKMLLNIKHDAE